MVDLPKRVLPEVDRPFIELGRDDTGGTNTTHDAVLFGGSEIILYEPPHIVEIAAK